MAVAMKIDHAPDIIEIIEIIEIIDDSDVFHDHPANTSTVDNDGRRWIGPAAAVALLALITYGVATSASSSGPSKVAAPTSTANVPSTISTRAAAYRTPVFYVADLPNGLIAQSATSISPDGTSTDFGASGPAELWASNQATATSGSWFIVSKGTRYATGRNSYRTVFGHMEMVIEHDPSSGQTRLSFTRDSQQMEINAFGWADRQLERIAASVSVDGIALRYADKFFANDHHLVVNADPMQALLGFATARVTYANEDLSQQMTITVGAVPDVAAKPLATIALTDTQFFQTGSKPETMGRLANEPTTTLIQWRDGDRLITLTGNLTRDEMIAVIPSVHPMHAGEVNPRWVATDRVLAMPTNQQTIGSGMMADGSASTLAVGSNQFGEYIWGVGQTDGSIETVPSEGGVGASIETLVEHGRTYVFAKAPASSTKPQLRIYRNGLPSVTVELSTLGTEFTDVFAAYVFLEPVPFNAEIVDGDGHIVASWPTASGS
jgi:hypothetical protein